MDSSLATSKANACAVPPAAAISAATSASLSRLRAAKATDAPARASSSAHARPIPCEAPVTSAIRPARMLMNLRETKSCLLYESLGVASLLGFAILEQGPDIYLEASRKMQDRGAVGQGDVVRGGEFVDADLGLCRLERPG